MLVHEVGSYANLNEALGRKRIDSTLSQYANQSKGSKSAKPKVMGSATARELERVCNKPVGWMDTDPDLEAAALSGASLARDHGPPAYVAEAPAPIRPWPFASGDYDRLMQLDLCWHGHVRIAMLKAIEECEGLSRNSLAN